MRELVFLLEEPSAKAMLEGLLPRILPEGFPCRYIVFEGKRDLDRQMVRRLRYYRNPGARFVVLRDKDAADCRVLKKELVAKCTKANRGNTLVRIACHELESWYLADLEAVETGLQIPKLAALQKKARYRSPDSLSNAAAELVKLTRERYQKISGSRAIGPHLDPFNERSRSFATFVSGVTQLCAD